MLKILIFYATQYFNVKGPRILPSFIYWFSTYYNPR